MYVITVLFQVKPGHVDDFHRAMAKQAENSLSLEPGCHHFDVCVDPADAHRVFLYEIYTDEAAFKAHLASAHFKTFDATVSHWLESKQVNAWALIKRDAVA